MKPGLQVSDVKILQLMISPTKTMM